MNIYSPTVITEEIKNRYKPTRLAVKELNGIKYFKIINDDASDQQVSSSE